MIKISADKKSFLRLKEQLALLMLDKKTRTRILKSIGKQVVKRTKKNIRAQRNPDGSAWAKRKNGRKKMMLGFLKKLKHYQKDNNKTVVIGWPSRRGKVALAHHTGKTEQSGVKQLYKQSKKNKEPKSTDPASRSQAKELRDAGYRLEPRGRQRRGQKPTIKFITAHFTVGEVAKKIAELEDKSPKRKWDVDRPERRLIGVSAKRVAMIIKREMNKNRSK